LPLDISSFPSRIGMDFTVDLENEPPAQTYEIRDVTTDWHLSTEMSSRNARQFLAKRGPKAAFRIRHRAAKARRIHRRFTTGRIRFFAIPDHVHRSCP